MTSFKSPLPEQTQKKILILADFAPGSEFFKEVKIERIQLLLFSEDVEDGKKIVPIIKKLQQFPGCQFFRSGTPREEKAIQTLREKVNVVGPNGKILENEEMMRRIAPLNNHTIRNIISKMKIYPDDFIPKEQLNGLDFSDKEREKLLDLFQDSEVFDTPAPAELFRGVFKLPPEAQLPAPCVPILNAPEPELYQSCPTDSSAGGSLDNFWTVYP